MRITDQIPVPEKKCPIIIVGAGGIVRDAHLPAYQKAGFDVFAIVDIVKDKAQSLADKYHIAHVFDNIYDALGAAPRDVIYDVALMPQQHYAVLQALPDSSYVIIQKPMGETRDEAKAILDLCRRKHHRASINFQLRYAPFIIAARSMIEQNILGELYDMEIRLTTFTPWEIFPAVAINKRLEILYHSIHYMDLIRSFLGTPARIMSRTFNHPLKNFSSTRTTTVFDYGKSLRGVINTNHDHNFGQEQQESFIKWEGTKGAIKIQMGLLMNYPHGVQDSFKCCLLKEGIAPQWQSLAIRGSWFPDAFASIMADMMRFKEGSISVLPTSVEDAIHTMELVESAYASDAADSISLS